MNDPTPLAAKRAIEDDYPEYLEQSFGFAYEVDDVMSQQALARRDALMRADAERLEALDIDRLDDFECWTVAHAYRRLGDDERFIELGRRVLASEEDHPVIVYSEISRGVAWALITRERYEEAARALDAHHKRWADDLQGRHLSALLAYLADGDEAHLKALTDEHPDDPELRYDVAEDLWQLGRHEAATRWIARARRAAEGIGDRAALVDIALLEERIEQR